MALGLSLPLVLPVCRSFEISPPQNLHEEILFHIREAGEHIAVIGYVTKDERPSSRNVKSCPLPIQNSLSDRGKRSLICGRI